MVTRKYGKKWTARKARAATINTDERIVTLKRRLKFLSNRKVTRGYINVFEDVEKAIQYLKKLAEGVINKKRDEDLLKEREVRTIGSLVEHTSHLYSPIHFVANITMSTPFSGFLKTSEAYYKFYKHAVHFATRMRHVYTSRRYQKILLQVYGIASNTLRLKRSLRVIYFNGMNMDPEMYTCLLEGFNRSDWLWCFDQVVLDVHRQQFRQINYSKKLKSTQIEDNNSLLVQATNSSYLNKERNRSKETFKKESIEGSIEEYIQKAKKGNPVEYEERQTPNENHIKEKINRRKTKVLNGNDNSIKDVYNQDKDRFEFKVGKETFYFSKTEKMYQMLFNRFSDAEYEHKFLEFLYEWERDEHLERTVVSIEPVIKFMFRHDKYDKCIELLNYLVKNDQSISFELATEMKAICKLRNLVELERSLSLQPFSSSDVNIKQIMKLKESDASESVFMCTKEFISYEEEYEKYVVSTEEDIDDAKIQEQVKRTKMMISKLKPVKGYFEVFGEIETMCDKLQSMIDQGMDIKPREEKMVKFFAYARLRARHFYRSHELYARLYYFCGLSNNFHLYSVLDNDMEQRDMPFNGAILSAQLHCFELYGMHKEAKQVIKIIRDDGNIRIYDDVLVLKVCALLDLGEDFDAFFQRGIQRFEMASTRMIPLLLFFRASRDVNKKYLEKMQEKVHLASHEPFMNLLKKKAKASKQNEALFPLHDCLYTLKNSYRYSEMHHFYNTAQPSIKGSILNL